MLSLPKKPVPKKKAPKSYEHKSRYSELGKVPSEVNSNLNPTSNAFMREILGEPRKNKDYASYDKGLDNGNLKNLHITDNVGPFRVTGLALAVENLKGVMSDIEKEQPDIYATLGTAGMSSVRHVIGNNKAVSNHSWGTAIDLTIDKLLDIRGDNKTQHGLVVIVPTFNKHGWYWGAKFPTEDSMHFEVSKEKMSEWAGLGYLSTDAKKMATGKQTHKLLGAKGPAESKGETKGQFIARVLAGQGKPSTNPLEPKTLPLSNIFRRPLPRRAGESYPRWIGRTATSWAKRPSSWFR